MARVLVVDDEPNICEMIAHALKPCGCDVETATGGLPAIRKIRERDHDVVITDVVMEDADGFTVLREAMQRPVPPEVIIITGFGNVESAVQAMKQGAADYITKPLDLARLLDTVRNLAAARARRNGGPGERQEGDFAEMVGRSPVMQQLYQLVRQVAATPSTVLISGESGTGKELIARAIHRHSPRAEGPFVPVDCGSLPETLLESELFGHVRGAFTGAVEDKTGLIEAADSGSLFLDEIAELTPPVQQKLLRTLQERAVRPIGSTRVRRVDVRVLSATNRDLSRLVDDGSFRQDLYYRLNVVPVPAPPLADRAGDIPLLARHFARTYARRLHRAEPTVSDTVLAMLEKARWPGNVRQLENVIECAVTFTESDAILPEHLPPDFIDSFGLPRAARRAADPHAPAAGPPVRPADITPLGAAIRYLERQMLSKALDVSGGNKEQAARMLGIDRATLYRKLKAHDLRSDAP
jgi:DNA-binding NtrC family response regulator